MPSNSSSDPIGGEHSPRASGASRMSRPSRMVAAVVAAVLLVTVAIVLGGQWGGFWGAGPGGDGQVSSSSVTSDRSLDARSGVDEVLTVRSKALADRDRQAWLATVDPGQPDVRQAQATLFDNLAAVPFEQTTFRYAERGGQLSQAQQTALGPTAWIAKVVFVYRISGVADTEVRREQYLTMAERDGRWYVAGTGDGPTEGVQRELWDLGPVAVKRGERSFIVAAGGHDEQDLDAWADQADEAAADVDEIWGPDWPRTVTVVVPDSQTQMAQLLGRTDEDGLSRIAAVTTGEVNQLAGQTADRVIINPAGFAELQPAGREVVLTHEVTHVATRAAGPGQVPIWFSEGFADYVAYTTSDLDPYRAVAEYLDAVDEGRIEPVLPIQADFDAAAQTELTMAYASAYLAVEYIHRTYGADAVLQLYRVQAGAAGPDGSPSSPMPLAEAMPKMLGVDEATFVEDWRAWVRQLAAASKDGNAAWPGS